jgi:peroxiredoxin
VRPENPTTDPAIADSTARASVDARGVGYYKARNSSSTPHPEPAIVPKINPGEVLPKRSLLDIDSHTVEIPAAEHLIHLQFRRFAGCPFCNLHLRSVKQRYDEIVAAGVREVVVFPASAATLHAHQPEMPFPIIPDPMRKLYRALGVETRILGAFLPRAWARSIRAGFLRQPLAIPRGGEHPFGLPADFLIAPNGRVIACKYGEHVYDQWTVDELLELARMPHEGIAAAK